MRRWYSPARSRRGGQAAAVASPAYDERDKVDYQRHHNGVLDRYCPLSRYTGSLLIPASAMGTMYVDSFTEFNKLIEASGPLMTAILILGCVGLAFMWAWGESH
jgi:hypothetical protein